MPASMDIELGFLLLFVVATAVAILVRHLRVPYTVGLVLAGLVLGLLHAFPVPHLGKELLFAVFLPGLLFEAAFHLDYADFRRNRMAIAALAVPGVAAAMGLIAAVLSPAARILEIAQGFDWRYALVFGALIAATDPIAVTAIFRSLGAPKRLSVLLEGESLLNDGTGIVFFTLSLTIVAGGAVSLGGLAWQFVEIVGFGGLIGVAVGYIVSQVIRQVDDPMIEITLTTVAAYGAFVAAEHFHYSGVIATVAAGMLCGNYGARTGMSASTRVAVESFWEYVAFALNSIVFLLIGMEVDLQSLWTCWPIILIAYLAVALARGVTILAVTLVLRKTRERFPFSWGVVLTWGGLRGALPMVLALSLPQTFVHRELIVNITFGVVLLSILIHGLSMSPILRLLGVSRRQEQRHAYESARGRLEAARSGLTELDQMSPLRFRDSEAVAALRKDYVDRVRNAEQELLQLRREHRHFQEEEASSAARQVLLAEKRRLIEAFHQGLFGREVYERLLAEIDARLWGLESGGGGPPAEPERAESP
jgi:CPA1 family monovalent cation:H+ antiporter